MKVNKEYYCRLINKENQQELEEVAQVMSDVFTGVQVGDRFISEPMVKYSGIQNESYKDFLFMYLKQIVRDEFTVVIRGSDVTARFLLKLIKNRK